MDLLTQLNDLHKIPAGVFEHGDGERAGFRWRLLKHHTERLHALELALDVIARERRARDPGVEQRLLIDDGGREAVGPHRGVLRIEYVEVSPNLQGSGLGRQLVAAAMAWARETDRRVVPICSYARMVIDRDYPPS